MKHLQKIYLILTKSRVQSSKFRSSRRSSASADANKSVLAAKRPIRINVLKSILSKLRKQSPETGQVLTWISVEILSNPIVNSVGHSNLYSISYLTSTLTSAVGRSDLKKWLVINPGRSCDSVRIFRIDFWSDFMIKWITNHIIDYLTIIMIIIFEISWLLYWKPVLPVVSEKNNYVNNFVSIFVINCFLST